MKHWIALGLLVGGAAAAQQQIGDCEDAYVECKEDCLIKWGGTTDLKKRTKNNQCITKCESVDRDCRESVMEMKKNNLDEGSLSGSPSSRDVDSDGMPTKTAQKKPPPPPKKFEEDTRDDAPPPSRKTEEKPVEQKRELAAEETPKSTRSSLKTDPKEKPSEKPAEPAPVVKKEEPKPPPPEKKAEEPPPPPPEKKKKEEKRDESKKERKALDEWDPEAL